MAICGYHGWHDWYLSASYDDNDGLEAHLISGLAPIGVPKALASSVHTFRYNDLERLKEILTNEDVGIIKMEVMRNVEPENNFLQEVRSLADHHGVILIFDECSSGFRSRLGGVYQQYGVVPDMVTFGKTIGNGYALTAVLGNESVMKNAENCFISSTFWTERIGFCAALKTIEVMERDDPFPSIQAMGKKIKNQWKFLAKKYGQEISVQGSNAIPSFVFVGSDHLVKKTFITQEMLSKGFLAGTVIYLSASHNQDLIEDYLIALEEVFARMTQVNEVSGLLNGPICDAGFTRLN